MGQPDCNSDLEQIHVLKSNPPIHWFPKYPFGQEQTKLLPVGVHFPPFKHGELWHGVTKKIKSNYLSSINIHRFIENRIVATLT